MGKRKYDNADTDPAKKVKTDDSDNIEDMESEQHHNQETSQSKNASQKHSFDMKHFRKELSSKQGQTMGKLMFFYYNHHNFCGENLLIKGNVLTSSF